jgi:hypothetical protein
MSLWEKFGIAVLTSIVSAALITSVVYVVAEFGIKKGWWKP